MRARSHNLLCRKAQRLRIIEQLSNDVFVCLLVTRQHPQVLAVRRAHHRVLVVVTRFHDPVVAPNDGQP